MYKLPHDIKAHAPAVGPFTNGQQELLLTQVRPESIGTVLSISPIVGQIVCVSTLNDDSLAIQRRFPIPEHSALECSGERRVYSWNRRPVMLPDEDCTGNVGLSDRRAGFFGLELATMSCRDARAGRAEAAEGSVELTGESIWLQVIVAEGAICHFSYGSDGQTSTSQGQSFTAQEGRWVGAKVGLFYLDDSAETPSDGYADFDWFRIN